MPGRRLQGPSGSPPPGSGHGGPGPAAQLCPLPPQVRAQGAGAAQVGGGTGRGGAGAGPLLAARDPRSPGRRAQLRRCLEQLRQQVPGGAERSRHTTLSLLHRARLHIQVRAPLPPPGWQEREARGSRGAGREGGANRASAAALKKLEEQERRAQRLKDRLQHEQRSLRRRLEQLVPGPGGERTRASSLDSSALSSERSDSDQGQWPRAPDHPLRLWAGRPQATWTPVGGGGLSRGSPSRAGPVKALPPRTEDAEIDVEMTVFDSSEGDMLARFSAGREHSYSSTHRLWL